MAAETDVRSVLGAFAALPDPRHTKNRKHLLLDVVVLAMLGVVAGADGPDSIEEWARIHHDALKKHLSLPYGIPSHDTIGRVLEALDPVAFQRCFGAWIEALRGRPCEAVDALRPPQRRHVAIDGKRLRRSHDAGRGLGPLHMVAAYACEAGLTLGQLAVDVKSNEIAAIPLLLELVDVEGAVVTIDAMGCQREVAAEIVDRGGDYVLALKDNHPNLFADVGDHFQRTLENEHRMPKKRRHTTLDQAHGRVEERCYYSTPVPPELRNQEAWKSLRSVGWVVSNVERDGKTTTSIRAYLSSLEPDAQRLAEAVRGHWKIENELHWSLDVTFREDDSRIRGRRQAANLSWLRRLALALLKAHPLKESTVMKRRMAGWSIDFMMQVLAGATL